MFRPRPRQPRAPSSSTTPTRPTRPARASPSRSSADRRGPRRLGDARLVVLHHRRDPFRADPPRAPAVPAQVHRPRAWGRAPRRHRRHRDEPRHRRRPRRQLRGLSRPSRAASAGFGGDVGDAARQPRRPAPLRPRPEGDARRRDHDRSARDSRSQCREPRAQTGRTVSAELVGKGDPLRHDPARPDGTVDTSRRAGRGPRPARPAVLRPRRHHLDPRVHRGRVQNEMGLEAVDPDLTRARGGRRDRRRPRGWCSTAPQDKIEAPPAADPTRDPDDDGVTQRGADQRSSTTWSSTCSTTSSRRPTPSRGGATDGARLRADRLRELPRARSADRPRPPRRRRRDAFDPDRGIFNSLFATASPRLTSSDDGTRFPTLKPPRRQPFLVRTSSPTSSATTSARLLRAQLRRHAHEAVPDRRPLWGVGSTAPTATTAAASTCAR